MQNPIDSYTLKARLFPALLAILPIIITCIALFPVYLNGWKSLYAIGVSCGLLYLLAELGRRAGALKQERLLQSWGGMPSVAMLRHRDSKNKALIAERHRKLALLFPDLKLPSAQEELRTPKEADGIYEVISKSLIDRTRDKRTFHLLFKENCSYGFWRNLWGLKPVGLFSSILSLAVIVGISVPKQPLLASLGRSNLIAPVLLSLAFLFIWAFCWSLTMKRVLSSST